jgi:peptidoglycan hydrolase-like protein with peptidoglycan-binding domain
MRRTQQRSGGYIQIVLVALAVIVIGVVVLVFLNRNHGTTKPIASASTLSSHCVGQTFTPGSSGHCVSDIQTLLNYVEHSGLTECPFTGGATLTVSGTYDTATASQVRSVQGWSDCYAKQEGFTSNVKVTGNVDTATWGELCAYGYIDPLHTSASGASAAIASGKDADCAAL